MRKNYIIDTSEKITVNGNDYYLRIRSCDPQNPVVLFLHGGCGLADRSFIMKWQSPLAGICTVVAWDQRGAGMAYDRKKAKTETLTKELYVADLNNVVQYLKERFNKNKIYIVGHSFGSQLGVWYAHRFPENIESYVGIGQVVDTVKCEQLSYDFTLREAKKRNKKIAAETLLKIGPPVDGFYKGNRLAVQRNYLNKFGGAEYGKHGNIVINTLPKIPCMFKEYSLKTMLNYLKANEYCLSQPLGRETVNFMRDVKELNVPVYIFMGESDYNTVYSLAKEWFEQLKAPYKKFFSFEKSGHTPQWEESERWNQLFSREVLKRELTDI